MDFAPDYSVDPYRYIQYVKYRKQYGNLEADYVIMKKALENGSSRSLSLVVDAPPNIVEGIEKDIDHFGEMIYGFSSKELEQIYSQMKLNGKTALICPGGNPIQIKMQSKITSDGKIECKYGLYSYNNEEKIRQIVFYVDDDYFAAGAPERKIVPLRRISLANHRFALELHRAIVKPCF